MTERTAAPEHDDDRYPRALVAVDVAAFAVLDAELQLLIVERRLAPQLPALPGGFLRIGAGGPNDGEDLEEAAARELAEETHLPSSTTRGRVLLEQVGVFGAPHRDPRARVISVAFLAVVPPELASFIRAGGDAAGVRWLRVDDLHHVTLAFDHAHIAARALEHLRSHVDEPRVLRGLVPTAFSLAELRAAVDAVRGTRSDAANFRRRFAALLDDKSAAPAAGRRITGKRQARLFTFDRSSDQLR